MSDRSAFAAMALGLRDVGLIDTGTDAVGLPDIPDVLADQVLCAILVCDECFGGREEVKKVLALSRDARRRAIAKSGAFRPLDGSVLRESMPGLRHAQQFALIELERALAAMREFTSPGGADAYVAEPVAKAIKDRHRNDPTRPRIGRPVESKPEADPEIWHAIRACNYLQLAHGDRGNARKKIMEELRIPEWRFYRALKSMGS